MTTVYFASGAVKLADQDLIGEGGEGRVYRVKDRAVKVWSAPNAKREKKLLAFPTQLPASVIAPIEPCTDKSGRIVGYAMRALDDAIDLHRFGQRKWRDGRVSNVDLMRLFRELGSAVAKLHGRNVVVGDLNDGNVVVTQNTPWLIDTDSMQFGAHACVVAHERFLDPRLYGVDLAQTQGALSRATDWYAFATLLFGSLLYIHPFGGAHPSYPTILRRAEARCSVLRADVKKPSAAAPLECLPDDALDWFERVFEKDLREPPPAHVLEARFLRCSCGTEHARQSCPSCTTRVAVPVTRTRGRVRVTSILRTRGRIVTACFQGSLKYVVEEDGVLRREDGTIVGHAPWDFVRIAGNATWIANGGEIAKVVGGHVEERHPVSRVHGELASDASLAGLVQVRGDSIVRAEAGTRAGQVLEGQTRIRVGDKLGFAFYRASEVTVAFVFDPWRGPLRQIERFPRIEGKLVSWTASFSEDVVLVTFVTETKTVSHLVSARGEVLATDDRGTGAVVGTNVLRASESDGLVLYRGLAPIRSFDDTRDLVPPDAELVPGPGGSLYVVTHDEISLLMFN